MPGRAIIPACQPRFQMGLENPVRYIIRASFPQERMRYLAREGTAVSTAKDGNGRKVFAAGEWLAAMCSPIPNHGEQLARYYGWYSNALRGRQRKKYPADVILCVIHAKNRRLGHPPEDASHFLLTN